MLREITEEDLDIGTLIDADEFVGMCITGELVDSDGFGRIVYEDEVEAKKEVSPSDYDSIPQDATHILWYDN